MRSKKNLVIGFLLLFLGIGLSGDSLLLSILAGVAGIVMMILYAASKLKQNTSETSAVSFKTSEIQPTTKTQQTNAQSVSFSPEAQQLYQQLADQYTQIVDNGCFGTLTQIAEKMDCCKHFLEQWMEALCNNDFYAIDLETTGLSAARNEIIQIAIIKFRHFQPVEILTSYVKPRKGLKPETAAINHITEDMVADAPYIEQIMQSVDTFIGEKAPIVAHNLQFEYKFLEANGCENIVKKRPLYDTLELSKRIWQLESYSLENVCRNSLRKLPNDDQLAAINYLVFSYTENVFMNPTTHKELRKNDLFMDMCRKSTDFRSHTPFPLDDPLEAAVKEFSLSKRNEIPNLLSREYALN